MGRQVRKVPKNWLHPKNDDGRYKPMYDQSYAEASAEWIAGFIDWHVNGNVQSEHSANYWEYAGDPPDEEYYRPDWKPEEMTHLMMYEDTSEGTPISPAFETPEELAKWLVDTRASSFGSMTASYESWLRICNGGWAPGLVIENGIMSSGVEFAAGKDV